MKVGATQNRQSAVTHIAIEPQPARLFSQPVHRTTADRIFTDEVTQELHYFDVRHIESIILVFLPRNLGIVGDPFVWYWEMGKTSAPITTRTLHSFKSLLICWMAVTIFNSGLIPAMKVCIALEFTWRTRVKLYLAVPLRKGRLTVAPLLVTAEALISFT